MNSLLESVIDAHGGANRWSKFSDLVTDVDVRGRLCREQGWSGMVPESRLLISLRDQRTIILLPQGRGRFTLEPDRLLHVDAIGEPVDTVYEPATQMAYSDTKLKWNALRTAYFLGNVIRHSVTAPFLYAFPGFVTEEVEPWEEEGEIWRVLKVTFPNMINVPSRVQHAYYGPEGLLRRLRNSVSLLGGVELVEYVSSYAEVDGIRIAISRDVYGCDSAGHKLKEQHLGHIELRDTFLTD